MKRSSVRIAEIADDEPDPAVWGRNFPTEYDAYKRTMNTSELMKYSEYGFRHSRAFTFANIQQLRITPGDLRNLQENCVACHAATADPILRNPDRQSLRCSSCHRDTGHAM